jgi:diguanylate cyclase (GGDEF)-like protein/PAS domain S-box-containing protein
VRAFARRALARLLGAVRRRPGGDGSPAPISARELATELTATVALVAVAAVMALTLGHGRSMPWGTAAWLSLLLLVMLAVEFDVATGRTSPVQLVLPAMVVLLPPAYVPLVVVGVHAVRGLCDVALGRRSLLGGALAASDAWYAVGPALVLAVAAHPVPDLDDAPIYLAALAALVTFDFVSAALRLRGALGLSIRDDLPAMGWVYLVDALLAPIGLLAAIAGDETSKPVVLVVPLAALLVVFARERRGRIENALALSRVAAENEQRLQALVQNASDLIVIAERDGTVRALTGAAREHFGPGWAEVAGTSLYDHTHLADHSVVTALLDAAANRPRGDSGEAEWRMRRPDGSWRHVHGIATNLLEDEHVGALVLTVRDIHERRAFEEELRHRAFHDELTGLPNRALLHDRVGHALARRGDRLVGLAYLDLDDFKAVNDRLGHAAGDELLVAFAGRLRNCVRTADTPARLSGDEFCVLLEDVGGPNEPVQIAERIVAALAEPLIVAGEPLQVTASVGVVVSTLEDDAPEELLRRADLALYAAKAGGKGRWQLYDAALDAGPGGGEHAGERPGWALRADQQREQVLSLLDRPDALRTVFQPIIDLRTGELTAYEALSRFDGPVDQPPNVWFEQAHRCGLGYRLEALAFERALAAPGRPAGTYLTVNLSLSTLASDEVQAVLPERLDDVVIEITENELVTEKADVLAAMALVRERGARLAVDDAGSGYAGLQHVMRLEPDVIKLDRTLVDGVADDPVKAALIEAFVRYARRIDAAICAEGIETLEDLERLADIDVAFGQGWAIGRPVAPWAPVSEDAAERCRARARTALHDAAGDALEEAADALSHVSAGAELAAALAPVSAELRAAVTVVHERVGDRLVAVSAAGRDSGAGALPAIASAAMLADGAVAVVDGPGAASDEPALDALRARGFGSLLAVPVTRDGAIVGAIELYASGPRAWSRYDLRRARTAGHHVAAALARLAARAEAVAPGATD